MKNTMKKILCTVLVVILCLTSAPIGGFVGLELPEWSFKSSAANSLAETGQCGEDVYWNYSNSTGELTISGTGAMWNYSFIKDSPFYAEKAIKSVTIENGVSTIGDMMFLFCYNIESLTIADTVTTIGEAAFTSCTKLTNLNIPNGVLTIGESAFESCSNITNVIIPQSVQNIKSKAFYNCTNLNSFIVDQLNECFSSDEYGVLFNKYKTKLIQYPSKNLQSNYKLPDSTMLIESYAFYNCDNLKKLIFNNALSTINYYAIDDCDNITELDIPNNVEIMTDSIFRCKNLSTITLGAKVNSIWADIFSISFYGCEKLESFIVNTQNKTFSSEDGVLYTADKSILVRYPLGKKNNSFTIPDSVTSLGMYAFSDCLYLKSVTLNDNLKIINQQAFECCKSLQEITIPTSIKTIETSNFIDCYNLTDVYYKGKRSEWDKIIINNGNDDLLNATIHFLGDIFIHTTCLFGDWFTETEPTVFNEGVSKRVCQCGKSETKAIAKLESGITKDQTTSIEIVYREENFDNEFTIVASEEILDKDIIFGDAYQNFKVYDISLEINNEKIQPKGYITVKIPLPEHFNPETTAVYYISDNNTVKLESKIENGFVIFETVHFSLYAIVDKFENTNPAENCSCNCHKGGIMGFFWKLINFFNKLLKNNQQCKCGVAHY